MQSNQLRNPLTQQLVHTEGMSMEDFVQLKRKVEVTLQQADQYIQLFTRKDKATKLWRSGRRKSERPIYRIEDLGTQEFRYPDVEYSVYLGPHAQLLRFMTSDSQVEKRMQMNLHDSIISANEAIANPISDGLPINVPKLDKFPTYFFAYPDLDGMQWEYGDDLSTVLLMDNIRVFELEVEEIVMGKSQKQCVFTPYHIKSKEDVTDLIRELYE